MNVKVRIENDGEVRLEPNDTEEAMALMGALGLVTEGRPQMGLVLFTPCRTIGSAAPYWFRLSPRTPVPDDHGDRLEA